jgi:hypothetical protein
MGMFTFIRGKQLWGKISTIWGVSYIFFRGGGSKLTEFWDGD